MTADQANEIAKVINTGVIKDMLSEINKDKNTTSSEKESKTTKPESKNKNSTPKM